MNINWERVMDMIMYALIGMVLGELIAAGIAVIGRALGWWP